MIEQTINTYMHYVLKCVLQVHNTKFIILHKYLNVIPNYLNIFYQDYSLNMYLRQTWVDERLKYSNLLNSSVTLNYDQISQLWIPDTFFRNLKKGMFHDITVPNRLIRLTPDGTILFSQR